MPLNFKDPEAEHLAAEVAELGLAGETKTRAVRVLAERRERLALRSPRLGENFARTDLTLVA